MWNATIWSWTNALFAHSVLAERFVVVNHYYHSAAVVKRGGCGYFHT